MDEDDWESEGEELVMEPQRFTWMTVAHAGLDFAGHILEGARCALGHIQHGLISHDIKCRLDKQFEDEIRWDLDNIPEIDEA